ncbi:MAG TPA: ASKHA domain-containing protein [Acidobacteriota bacterium]|nr:ASKHA domain-containing protein [Acidobacteriota bacterium]
MIGLVTVDFQPVGIRGKCSEGQSILECGRHLNVDIVSICGGIGMCGKCRVQVVEGRVSERSSEEEAVLSEAELRENYRLACLTAPLDDVRIYLPAESLTAPQRTQVEGLELEFEPDPPIQEFDVVLRPPTLEIPQSDEMNLCAALREQHGVSIDNADIHVLRELSPAIRQSDWRLRAAMRGGEIVALGLAGARWFGLAVDLGTTKIAAYLLDLRNGKTVASRGLMNPQIPYGEDVVSRIAFAGRSPESAAKLQRVVADALNDAIGTLCGDAGVTGNNIVEAVVVGNTAMHHLFLNLPVKQLGISPYVPALRSAVDVKARDIGLRISPGGYVHLLPNIAGYVGADHVAMLLGTGIHAATGIALAVDIGTNTEICLNNHGKLSSVSCASGPAFEGAHIKNGMRASPGAIEHVRLAGERMEIQTIGGVPPIGICGSGLLDAAAQLRLNNALDASGKMLTHPLIRGDGAMREFVLAERPGKNAITVTQKDIRELQMAKAAIRLGVFALLEAEGLREDDIQEIVIAGAFGTFIDVESAVTIGMLPPLPLERFRQVGNAAGTGARMALVSGSRRSETQSIAERTRYIELAGVPEFSRRFAEASALTGKPPACR